jgi:hypothetical protein
MNWYDLLKTAMPLDPNAHNLHGDKVHRLPEHSGYTGYFDPHSGRFINQKAPITPEKQKQIDQIYSGVHATLSPEVAAIYANNNSTPQDPPVILGFVTKDKWVPDADATREVPEPLDLWNSVKEEVPDIEQLASQPYKPATAKQVMEAIDGYDDMFGETEWDDDLLNNIARSHRATDIRQIPAFYKHYYGRNATQKFWSEYVVPMSQGKGFDQRIWAFMNNQVRFMQPVPDKQIQCIGTTERFSTEYADRDGFDLDEWNNDPDNEGVNPPELNENNQLLHGNDGRLNVYNDGEPFDPVIQWVWRNPQPSKGTLFYHGTTKSRALQALPQLSQYINLIK